MTEGGGVFSDGLYIGPAVIDMRTGRYRALTPNEIEATRERWAAAIEARRAEEVARGMALNALFAKLTLAERELLEQWADERADWALDAACAYE